MKPSARSAIRSDLLAGYEPPAPDLAIRVLRAVPASSAPQVHRVRVALQTLAVAMIALVIGVAMVGVRVSRGEMALPAGLPFGVGGLHPPAANYSIVDAQYLSANTAWIIAQLHEHNGPTVVMNTVDGGKTWQEQFRIPDGSGIGSFRFWNLKDGELVENVPSTLAPSKVPGAPGSSNLVDRIYRTQDGGAHWALVDRPIDWSHLGGPDFSLTQLEAWRITGREPKETSAMIVQHTVDGGNSWTTLGKIPAGANPGSNLAFTDRQTGWLTANASKSYAWDGKGNPIPFTPAAALLWVTRDAGKTWAPIDIPLPAEAAANDVRLEAPVMFGQDGLLEFEVTGPAPTFAPDVQHQAPVQGWMHSYMLQTHDGGRHWGQLERTPGGVQEGGALFFDARHWLISKGSSITETFDAGKTWTTRQILTDGLQFSFAPWNYIDAKTIWSQVGADRLVRSTDGGAHWTAVTPPTIK